jgi:putative ABC transport system permease protein
MNLIAAFRALRKAPGEVMVATVALATGIGLVTTLFSLLSAVALTTLPFPDGDRLVYVGSGPAKTAAYREHQTSFEGVAGVAVTGVNAVANGSPRRYRAAFISANFFDLLRAKPLIGAGFDERHERSEPGVILSYSAWKDDYEEDSSVVGKSLLVNGRPLTITAVMPESFAFPRTEQIWVAWDHTAANPVFVEGRGSDAFRLARLKSNVTLAHAATETNQIAQRLHETAGQSTPRTFIPVARYADRVIKGEIKQLMLAMPIRNPKRAHVQRPGQRKFRECRNC